MVHAPIVYQSRPSWPARSTATETDQRRLPPPSTPLTPFYITARTAPTLTLSFVVPGCKGETLDFEAEILDLAFVLERTLKKRGIGERMARSISQVHLSFPDSQSDLGLLHALFSVVR